MAAEQAQVAAEVVDEFDERAEILRKINRTLVTLQKSTGELVELIAVLTDGTKRAVRTTDEYGEPTWTSKVKTGVPGDMYVTRKFLEYGAKFGFNHESMQTLMHGKGTYEGFIKYYQRQIGQKNGKWSNWSLVFMKWVRTEHERKQKKAQQHGGTPTRFGQLRTRS